MTANTLTARPAPRDSADLMLPNRLAALQPSRVSGSRALMNRMIRERWDIRLTRMDVDAQAQGTILYSVCTPDREFSLIAFSFAPRTEGRTGRIIGRAWDMMCSLIEGPANEADIAYARSELPKLYRGRAAPNTLVWGRSNRSMRVFSATLDALAAGRQPSVEILSQVCYLMRNTGLDGNGTFGTRSFPALGADHPLGGMLQAQLLTAYLMRELSCDLVSHLAGLQSDKAVPLAPDFRRWLGVGNGSALGLIFFVHKHPQLIHSWLSARETALAQARALSPGKGDARLTRLLDVMDRAIAFRRQDRMVYEAFASSAKVADDLTRMRADIQELATQGTVGGVACAFPLDAVSQRHRGDVSFEALETYHSLLLELVPEAADALMAQVHGADEITLDPADTVAGLLATIRSDYAWALDMDLTTPESHRYIWYKSENAEEPRRGAREEVPEARDLGLDVPGGVQALYRDLSRAAPDESVARFVLRHPGHRHAVARIQSLRGLTYHTPHANINDAGFVPIDMVRLMNVGLHGIDKTRDFLNRNLRGVLFHGAPTPDEIRAGIALDWFYPQEPCA
ncbi:MAG: hypothetical protein Q7J57_04375 [Gemmobacter sp.]|nr:hypothetical protein [Gemmobacter sp.]